MLIFSIACNKPKYVLEIYSVNVTYIIFINCFLSEFIFDLEDFKFRQCLSFYSPYITVYIYRNSSYQVKYKVQYAICYSIVEFWKKNFVLKCSVYWGDQPHRSLQLDSEKIRWVFKQSQPFSQLDNNVVK